MSTLEEIRSSGTMLVVPWHDELVDAFGHDPRSYYVERFWLPVLGPSTVFLLRLVASALETSPEGCELDLAETARRLGLGERMGRHAPVVRTVGRCVDFEMARPAGLGTLAVRRRLPPLARRHQARLTTGLAAEHDRWAAAANAARPRVADGAEAARALDRRASEESRPGGPPEPGESEVGRPGEATTAVPMPILRERGRQLALSLLQLGEDRAATEHQLIRWHYHPSLAGECAAWAASVHTARCASPVSGSRPQQLWPQEAGAGGPAEGQQVALAGDRVPRPAC